MSPGKINISRGCLLLLSFSHLLQCLLHFLSLLLGTTMGSQLDKTGNIEMATKANVVSANPFLCKLKSPFILLNSQQLNNPLFVRSQATNVLDDVPDKLHSLSQSLDS